MAYQIQTNESVEEKRVEDKAMKSDSQKEENMKDNLIYNKDDNKYVERIARTLVHKGSMLNIYSDTMKVPNGKLVEWDFVEHKGAAAVVPVLPDGRILLVRQLREALDTLTWEIPAGGLDGPNEPTIVAAARELEEETGYKSSAPLIKLISIATAVAFCNEMIDIYIADHLTKTVQNLDEEECIDVEAFSLEEIENMVFNGLIIDSKTISAMMSYAIYVQRNS